MYNKALERQKYRRIKEIKKYFSQVGEWVIDRSIQKGKLALAYYYLGHHINYPDITVMIKQLYTNYLSDLYFSKSSQQFLKKLGNEIIKLKNPYLLKHLGIIIQKTDIYFIQEYLKHGNLFQYLFDKGSKLKEEQALIIFKQVLLGYKNLYDEKIYHFSINPINIHIENPENGKLKFEIGITRFMNSSYVFELPIIFAYMPPQRIKDFLDNKYVKYGSKCDMWSLGVLLYEMVEGKLPFEGLTHPNFFYEFDKSKNNHLYEDGKFDYQGNYQVSSNHISDIRQREYDKQIPFYEEKYQGNNQKIMRHQLYEYLQNILKNYKKITFQFKHSNELKQLIRKLIWYNEEERLDYNQIMELDIIKRVKLPWEKQIENQEKVQNYGKFWD